MEAEKETNEVSDFFNKVVEGDKRRKKKSTPMYAEDKTEEAVVEAADAPSQKLVQYAHHGPGYVPTAHTIKKLPSDCYKLEVINRVTTLVPQKIVTDDLIDLPDSKSDEVIQEISDFWKLKETYRKYGFTHKRGFILWGPPGSGKTCTIAVLIKEMVKRNGIVIVAQQPKMLTAMLLDIREVEPERQIIVILEDLDSIVEQYGESDVLSLLDGEMQVDNIVFIATTNYPERLDARIVNRPSRFDRIVKIEPPNAESRKMYLMKKLGKYKVGNIDLVEATKGLSFAHLKELIVSIYCLKKDIKGVIERLQRMKITPKSGFNNGQDLIGIQ